MYKLSEPFDSQALESFESRVLASETKFEYSRVASRNAYSFRLASTRYARVEVPLLAAGTVLLCYKQKLVTKLVTNFPFVIQKKTKFARRAIFSAFYNISEPNFATLRVSVFFFQLRQLISFSLSIYKISLKRKLSIASMLCLNS